MDKTTVWLIRFTCGFIILGGIFGALWRINYVKNIERQGREELRYKVSRQIWDRYMGNCYLENKDNDDWINYCDEKWEKRLKELGDDANDLKKLGNF